MGTDRLSSALFVLTAVVSIAMPQPMRAQQASPALRIVVVEGEGAVNIIQQKTAVAPVIEVRDRNDQPVAGAVVQFMIRNGRATFGGARALTVTTNAAGQAAAAGLTPTGSGALQISATAAFQGQSAAAVTIAQTNVITAAQAAAASSAASSGASGSSGGSAAGGGAGGGGGLSMTTVAIVGGAAAAGAVVAAEQLSGGSKRYSATFSGVMRAAILYLPQGVGCTEDERQTGTIEATVDDKDGAVSGTISVNGDIALSPGTCQPGTYNTSSTDTFGLESGRITGTAQNLTMTANASNNYQNAEGQGVNAYDFTFTGTFDGTQISGTLRIERTGNHDAGNGFHSTRRGIVSYEVVMR